MLDALTWLISHLLGGFANLFLFIVSPSAWPTFGEKQWLGQFIYYGASVELFFVVLDIAIFIVAIGLWHHSILWGIVRGIEALNNAIGRFAAWAALIMVVQQVLIQRQRTSCHRA